GVSLAPGAALPASYLEDELEARAYRAVAASPVTPGTYRAGPGGFEIALRGFPDERDPEGGGGPERVRVALDGARVVRVDRLGGLGAIAPDTAHAPRL